MAPRRYVQYEGRYVEASAVRQHNQLSAGYVHPSPRRLPHPGFLANIYANQAEELNELVSRNNDMSRDLDYRRHYFVSTQRAIKELREHIRNIRDEGDRETKDLLEKIAEMERDIKAGERIKKELEEASVEEERLLGERRVLTSEIQQASQELEKAETDIKRLPELRAQRDSLREKRQRTQKEFLDMEYSIVNQVAHMQIMEANLAEMAKKEARLRAALNTASQPNAAGLKEEPDAHLVCSTNAADV